MQGVTYILKKVQDTGRVFRYIFWLKKTKRMPLQPLTQNPYSIKMYIFNKKIDFKPQYFNSN